jgi:PAS domain S-box-containing protein
MRIGTRATTKSNKRIFLPRRWLAVSTILFVGLLAGAAAPDNIRMVVVLYPDNNDGSPGNSLVDQSIRATFASASSERIEIHNEYLDTSPVRDDGLKQLQVEFLRQKYAGRKVDLVIAGLSSALDFVLEHREKIFPGVPIVFCAVDERELLARKLAPDVIGVPVQMDLIATLDLALRLHPHTERVFVIAGKAKFDTDWEAEARQTFRAYQNKLEFVYLAKLPLEDLLKEVAHLPERSIIYYLHVHQDGTGRVLVPAEVLALLAAKANAPIYGHVDSYIGRGIVGGHAFTWEAAGGNAARLGLRILAGEKPEMIGVQKAGPTTPMFDWRQLRRWDIREESLPPGSVVRYREASFWDLYRWHISAVMTVCVIQALLIVGLLAQWANRRRAEKRFRETLEAAPNGMLMVGRDGRIVLANAQMEKLFGYGKAEMLGQRVEMLVPERFRKNHPAQRDGFFAMPEVRPMGAGRDLFGRRKDASEFPVEIGLSPVQTDTGLFVLASIVDITERRRAEEGLRESQHELRVLAGRLLQTQETERGRIARELHDDLGQSLALLSVEMDLLRQKPCESAAQLKGRIQELSTRVKQLSSSVHELSHKLHPSKVKQLGLVAAVRAVCRELAQTHGVPIDFTQRQVSDKLPEDTALCLYRIVQEALRNVIKHSGARRASVELLQSADMLCLRIVDDGSGFDPMEVPGSGGLGLVSMRERLHLVRGQIAIDSRPARGTRIDVRVPLYGDGQAEGALPAHPAGIG